MLTLTAASLIVSACVLIFAYQQRGQIDGYAFESIDCREYYRLADNLVQHGFFSQAESSPFHPDAWRTPGYPLFLATWMWCLGLVPRNLVLVQQVLTVINVLLFYIIARHHMNPKQALLCGLLFLCEPYHHFYSLWLMSATLFVTCMLLTWIAWQKCCTTKRARWLITMGLLAGGLILVRPLGILVPPMLLIGVGWIRARNVSMKNSIQSVLLLCLATTLSVAPWLIRNKVEFGHWALSSQSGAVFAYFKATEVVLWHQGRTADRYTETSLSPAQAEQPHTIWNDIDTRLRNHFAHLGADQLNALQWSNLAQGNRTRIDSFEISVVLRHIAWEYLMDTPRSTLACYTVRCGSLLTFPLNLYVTPPAQEKRNVQHLLLGSLYVLFCVWALINTLRRQLRSIDFFAWGMIIALLLTTTPQVDPRFRVPMIPLLLLLGMLPRPAAAHEKAPTSS